MTNEELIQKIRAEIERLIEESDFDESANLYSLLSFLSTLQEQEVKEKSQDTVGRVSVEIRSNLETDEVVRKTLIMLVNDGRISVTGAITSSDILNWLEGQKESEVDLEKEMDEYFENMVVQEHENIFEDTFHNIARHFAQWGAEHLKK